MQKFCKQWLIVTFILICSQQVWSQPIDESCGLNEKARKLAALIISNPDQQRSVLTCNAKLAEIAANKAKEMALLGRVTHVGKQSANQRLIDSGYPLADIYPHVMSNQVEAIAGGLSTAEEVLADFLASDSHHMHLLGKHEFYMMQNEIGVGFHYDWKTPHVEYWVVYIAHQNPTANKNVKIAPSKD